MIIYFFKDRSKERVDFGQLIDEYFDKLENTIFPESARTSCSATSGK